MTDRQAPASAGAAPMSGAELRCTVEYLGLTDDWAAARLGVTRRTVQRWMHGERPIPLGVQRRVESWVTQTWEEYGLLLGSLSVYPGEPILTFRRDEDYWARRPDSGWLDTKWPARWHRALAARVAAETGARIEYLFTG